MFVSDTGVAVEKATGEIINGPQEDVLDTTAMAIEIPHSVEHQPYIPLASAQDALARVCLALTENAIIARAISTDVLYTLIKVVNDMKRMKEEHIDLVERMQGAYREIEEESKVRKIMF